MCVCLYVHVGVTVHMTCVSMHMNVMHTQACMYLCVCACVYEHACICARVLAHMYVYICAYMCVYKPASVQVSLRLSSGSRLRIKEDEIRTRIREQ